MRASLLLLSTALLAVASLAQGDPSPARSAVPATSAEVAEAPRADVRVRIIGIDDDSGAVRVALFGSAEAFEANAYAARQQTDATPPAVELIFEGLPLGRYAISCFHDRNGNEKLDSNLVGMPTEPYGFSRNARGRFGPPSFDEMVFDLGAGGADIEIEVH